MSDFLSAQSNSEEFETEKSFSNKMPDVAIFCTNCGAHLETGDLFCVKCGTKVENYFEKDSFDADEKDEKNKETSAGIEIKNFQDRLNAINTEKPERKSAFLSDLRNLAGRESFSKPKSFWTLDNATRKTNATEVSLTSATEKNFENNKALLGYYVRRDSERVENLVIKNIDGTKISGELSIRSYKGSFANETFTGTLEGESIKLKVVQKDMHPKPDVVKRIWENNEIIIKTTSTLLRAFRSFSGIISPQEITGTWILEDGDNMFLTYTKS